MAEDKNPALADLVARLESGVSEGPLPVRRFAGVEVTVAEIREALAANPGHPLAWVFSRAVEGLSGAQKVAVDRNDLLGLATNHAVRTRRVVVGDEVHVMKEVGASLARKPAPAPPPAEPAFKTPAVKQILENVAERVNPTKPKAAAKAAPPPEPPDPDPA